MFASFTKGEKDVVFVQVKLLKRTTSVNDGIAKNWVVGDQQQVLVTNSGYDS